MKVEVPTSDQWYLSTELTKIREFNIAIKKNESGDKPWLVLLHGFPTCSYDWYKLWPILSEKYNLFAFDFLGFGRSDKPFPHRYSIIEQAEITLALLSQQKINSCFILAHDYAVSVTQEIISRVKENRSNLHVRKIIFLNGGLFPEMHRPITIQKLLLSPLGRAIGMMVSRNSIEKNLRQVFGPNTQLSKKELDELWSLITFNKGKRVFHLLIKYILDRRENRERWVANMQKTSIPMLLVNGPLDPVSGRHLVERYEELIPNSQTYIIEGIGHYPNLEAPEHVAEQVFGFFEVPTKVKRPKK